MSGPSPQRHPLAWPAGRKRTDGWRRKYGQFKSDQRPVTVSIAIARLTESLDRLGAIYPLLSTDVPTRMDGTMILNKGLPADPGACAYFQLKGKPFALACDTFTDLAQNIAALAAHVEATRAIERYGVASAAETLEAFSALPPPAGGAPAFRPWRVVFEMPEPFWPSVPVLRAAFRERAQACHPDKGGSEFAMAELNAALDEALRAAGP